jgi:hypothetical protein
MKHELGSDKLYSAEYIKEIFTKFNKDTSMACPIIISCHYFIKEKFSLIEDNEEMRNELKEYEKFIISTILGMEK